MSRNIEKTTSKLEALKKEMKGLSKDEKNFLIANSEFQDLKPDLKKKYVQIYKSYTEDDKTMLEVSYEMDICLRTVKHALKIIGDQLYQVSKARNVLAIQIDRIKRRRRRIEKDLDNLNFVKNIDGEDVVLVGVAEAKRKYYTELRELDNQEHKLMKLLENKVIIDNSKQEFKFESNYEKPVVGGEHEVRKNEPIEIEPEYTDELPGL